MGILRTSDEFSMFLHVRDSKVSSLIDPMKARFRIIFPAAYIMLSALLFLLCLLHLGHSVWCEYFLRSMFPASLLRRIVPYLAVSAKGSEYAGMLDTIVSVLLPYSLTVAQYFFLGRLIDYLLRSRTLAPKGNNEGCIHLRGVMHIKRAEQSPTKRED